MFTLESNLHNNSDDGNEQKFAFPVKFLLLLAAKFRTWKTDLMSQRCLGNFMNNAYLE